MTPKVPNVTLNNGRSMPAFALGTLFAKDAEIEQAVKDAIDVGYRHFDTAHLYQNEAPIGRAIRAKIAEGVVKREDVFVTTKLWCTYFEPSLVLNACKASNEALGLGYIDLYIMHASIAMPLNKDKDLFPRNSDGSPATLDVDYLETYKKLEECVDQGLVKSIGVSNFNSEQIKRVYDNARIKPVCNQVECSPTLNQKKMIEFCKKLDIIVTAYSPLGQHNAEKKTPSYLYDEKVHEIAKKYGKSAAQVVLRYIYELGTVPLPKSTNKGRMTENINIFDFKLSDEDRNFLESFNNGSRLNAFPQYASHKYYPYSIEF